MTAVTHQALDERRRGVLGPDGRDPLVHLLPPALLRLRAARSARIDSARPWIQRGSSPAAHRLLHARE